MQNGLSLTYLTAPKGSLVFGGAALIQTAKQTPGEIGRRKAQLAAVVEAALAAETPLLVLPGEFEPGVAFVAVPAVSPEQQATPGDTPSPFAEAEAELARREEALAERELAIVEREKALKKDEKKAAKQEE
ncbi:MAG: hypothetical protein IPK72_21180 [Candidatus Eisenbacteria bacterium]|nr:hypothetical protein [Candidatus Eisenbacteria bacterium]